MGLDVVELVMEIEDEFGIQITNEDYPKLVTVGDLRDLVVVKLAVKEGWEPVGQSSFCPSAALFLWLRKGLSTALDQPHLRVRPSDRLDAYIPMKRRPLLWSRWGVACEMHLPELVYRPRFAWLPLSGAFIAFLTTMVVGITLFSSGRPDVAFFPMVLSVPGSLLVGLSLLTLRDFFPRRALRPGLVTFGDLVRAIGPLDWQQWQTLKRIGPAERREEIWRRVQKIVSEQLNIPLPEIRPESRFVEDLRAR